VQMQQSADLKSLDELIAKLGGVESGSQSPGLFGLLLEHMQGARRGLMGSMRAEYRSNLQFARESVACIPGKTARDEATNTLQGLIDNDHMRASDHMRSLGSR
jgi:hypothetical protein